MYKRKRNIVIKSVLIVLGSSVLSFCGFFAGFSLEEKIVLEKETEINNFQTEISELKNQVALLSLPGSDFRQVFVDSVELNDFVYSGDRVDIRTVNKDGLDEVILTKLDVVAVTETGFILSLREEDIKTLTLSTTALDSGVITRQYAVRYPE